MVDCLFVLDQVLQDFPIPAFDNGGHSVGNRFHPLLLSFTSKSEDIFPKFEKQFNYTLTAKESHPYEDEN